MPSIIGFDEPDVIYSDFVRDLLTGGGNFYYLGAAGHSSDWVQICDAAEGDVLLYGISATRDDFQINIATTNGAGASDVDEAFIIHRPTGQIVWALVDGAGQDEINLQIGEQVFDLMA